MATTVTKEFRFQSDNAKTYAEAEMNVLDRDGNFIRLYLNNSRGEDVYLKQVGKDQLFPTSTAKPYRLDHSMRYRRTVGGTSHFYFYIDNTEIHHTSTTSNDYTTNDKTNITVSAVTNCTSASEFRWYVEASATSRGALLLWDKFIFYFYQYACAASTSTGIASASVDNASPYNGDPITYTCTPSAGYQFEGWYNGSTKVSSSQTYSLIADSDLTLTAKATKISSFVYIKSSNSWTNGVAIWKKVGGTWVKQTSASGIGISNNTNLIFGGSGHDWSLDQDLPKGAGTNSNNGWITTDYLPILPNTAITVHGAESSSGVLFNTYNSDKSYYDWWGYGSMPVVDTINGTSIYERTLEAAKVANCYWIRLNVPKAGYDKLKLWQNSVLIFDGGACAPPA